MKHRRVVVTRRGGTDVLQGVEEDLPEPGAGEVRVKVLAAGVSAYDLVIRRYSFLGVPRVPFTQGEDIVGLVDKLGEGVSAVEPGQRVAGYPRGGGYAELVCLPASELVPVPLDLDPAEAVCLARCPQVYLAAIFIAVRVHSCSRAGWPLRVCSSRSTIWVGSLATAGSPVAACSPPPGRGGWSRRRRERPRRWPFDAT